MVTANTQNTQNENSRDLPHSERGLITCLAEISPAGILVVDRAGRVTFANARAERVLGLTRDGHPLADLPPPFYKVLDTGQTLLDARHTVPGADKRQVLLSLNAAPLFDGAGQVDHVVMVFQDITDQARRQEEKGQFLEQIKNHNAALVQMATDPALTEGHLEEALQVITKGAAGVLDVDRVNICKLSADGREMQCLTSFDRSTGRHTTGGQTLPVDQFPSFFAALENDRVVDASDVTADSRTARLAVAYWKSQRISASLSVPIRLYGQVIGLAFHNHIGPRRSWTPDEVTFAIQVADLAAQVFLKADLRRRADELAVITRVSREITSMSGLQEKPVLTSIARHAAQLSNSDASGVFAFRPDGRLYIEASYGVQETFVAAINAQGVPPGSGAIGRATAGRCPVQVPDTRTEPNYSYGPIAEMEKVRGILAVPMLRNEEVIGGIVLWHRQPRHFAQEQVLFLQALAQQCTNAVENARLYEAEARRRQEAETLQAATQALSTTLDLPRIFELILTELEKVVPYDSASIQQRSGQYLEIIDARGFANPEEIVGLRFDLTAEDNPNRQVIHTKAPLILDDASVTFGGFRRAPHAQAGIRSWLGVPMVVGERIIGLIALDKRAPDFYTPNHARLAQAFAAQAAVAIQNARMFAEQERSRAERESLITELEAKNADLEAFVYTVSHDLKSPLITIQGFLKFVERAAVAGDVAQIKADVARISDTTAKMQQLVSDLLDLSRIGRQTNPSKKVPFNQLAHEALRMVAGRLEKRNVEVVVAPDLPAVYGDRSRLRQVLVNLIDNAAKYMGNPTKTGRPRIEIGGRREGGETIFYVQDNGIGIDPRYQNRIFDLFEKLDPETEGTGLGLAIVKRIIEVHGGRIWVESEGRERGSTFCFTLPVK